MTEGQVLVDRSNRGVVKVTGPDRLTWLHSLTSQHLERLAPGSTAEALILSPAGPPRAPPDAHRRRHRHLDPRRAAHRAGPGRLPRLDALHAPGGGRGPVRGAGGADAGGPAPGRGRSHVQNGCGRLTGRPAARRRRRGGRSHDGPFGIDLIVAPEAAGKLAATYPVAGMWAFEAARIAARVPRPGLDTDHKTLPHEVGLIETAVHLNKGCYRGQETVARIHNLGHPPRRLVFLHLDGSVDRLPAHGVAADARRRHAGRIRRLRRPALRARPDRARARQAVGGRGRHAAGRRDRRRAGGDRPAGRGRQREGHAAAGQRAAAAGRPQML